MPRTPLSTAGGRSTQRSWAPSLLAGQPADASLINFLLLGGCSCPFKASDTAGTKEAFPHGVPPAGCLAWEHSSTPGCSAGAELTMPPSPLLPAQVLVPLPSLLSPLSSHKIRYIFGEASSMAILLMWLSGCVFGPFLAASPEDCSQVPLPPCAVPAPVLVCSIPDILLPPWKVTGDIS